jgi:hypothetical protein
MYICSPFGGERAISSVGLEHLPYKQGVVGSNPTSPTNGSRGPSPERFRGLHRPQIKRLLLKVVFFFRKNWHLSESRGRGSPERSPTKL